MPQRGRQQHIIAKPGAEFFADRDEPLLLAEDVLAQPSAGTDEDEGLVILVPAVNGPANETTIAGRQQEFLIARVVKMNLQRGLMRRPQHPIEVGRRIALQEPNERVIGSLEMRQRSPQQSGANARSGSMVV